MIRAAGTPTCISSRFHVGRQHGQSHALQRFESLRREREHVFEVAGVVEAIGADRAVHRVAAHPGRPPSTSPVPDRRSGDPGPSSPRLGSPPTPAPPGSPRCARESDRGAAAPEGDRARSSARVLESSPRHDASPDRADKRHCHRRDPRRGAGRDGPTTHRAARAGRGRRLPDRSTGLPGGGSAWSQVPSVLARPRQVSPRSWGAGFRSGVDSNRRFAVR